jgi:hypothetical protein
MRQGQLRLATSNSHVEPVLLVDLGSDITYLVLVQVSIDSLNLICFANNFVTLPSLVENFFSALSDSQLGNRVDNGGETYRQRSAALIPAGAITNV